MVSEFDLALSNDIASKIESFGNEFQYVVYTALFGEVDELHDPVGIENDNAYFRPVFDIGNHGLVEYKIQKRKIISTY